MCGGTVTRDHRKVDDKEWTHSEWKGAFLRDIFGVLFGTILREQRSKYQSAHASLSRAVRNLETRGVVVTGSVALRTKAPGGKFAWNWVISLTPLGETLASSVKCASQGYTFNHETDYPYESVKWTGCLPWRDGA
jgi:hypothetical protein